MAPALYYGLAATGLTALWVLLEFLLGLHSRHLALGHYANYGVELIFLLVLWRALHQQLYAENRYWLPVWQGLLRGLLIGLVAAMGAYILLSLYLQFINPEYSDLYLEWRVARLRADGVPEEQVRAMARFFRWSLGPVGLPASIGAFYLLFAFVASPLLTLWLNWRRKDPGHIG